MRTECGAKLTAGRIGAVTLLAGAALLLGLACSSKGRTRRYGNVATTAAGDGVEWRSAAPGCAKLPPAEGSWNHYRELKAGEGTRVAGVLFHLKPLPVGARVSRAVLRLRRKTVNGSPAIAVMNINKGLRVLRFADGEPLYGILRARMSSDKREMLRVAFNSDTDEQISGLALSEYPVECSLASESYKCGLFARGKPYHELLQNWNPIRNAGHKLAGAWDEVEVTAAVRAQLAADKLLLVGVKVTNGSIAWFAHGRKYPWAAPQLIVEYSKGAVAKAPAPAPPPASGPKAGPEPDPKILPVPQPKPELDAGKGKIMIGSEPARADIYIDGKYVGTTPSRELAFPAGEMKVRVEKKGYKPWERAVTILKNNVVNVAPELEKK